MPTDAKQGDQTNGNGAVGHVQSIKLGGDMDAKPEDGTLNDRAITNTYKSPIIPGTSEDYEENYNGD